LIYSGLNFPVSFRFSPDGRVFFNEKNTGNIRIIQDTSLLPAPFATVSVATDGEEQGLLGLELDPNFSSNGFVYAYYTYSGGSTYHGHITRFTAAGNTGSDPVDIFDVADTTPTTTNHNGGYLKFGPDGKLYVQVGEFSDKNQAQNLSSNTGKILRMNPDGTVPSDNQFPNSLVYAYGIRNGFGMDFDKLTGQLVETEPGPTSNDEINIIVAGGNYGWPICLGKCGNPSYIDPIATFTPVTTPTGIAYVSPRTYYFGEWTGASLEKLALTSSSTVDYIAPVWSLGTPNNGVSDVVLGPDTRLYFSTGTGIYAYDIPLLGQPSQASRSLLPLVASAVIIVTATIAITMILFQRRRRHAMRSNEA